MGWVRRRSSGRSRRWPPIGASPPPLPHLDVAPEPPQISPRWAEWLRGRKRDTQRCWLGWTYTEKAPSPLPFPDMMSFAKRLGSNLPGETRGGLPNHFPPPAAINLPFAAPCR